MRKTYEDGSWRFLLDDGRLGDISEPATAAEREAWLKEASTQDWIQECPQCGGSGSPTPSPGVWCCENMHNYRAQSVAARANLPTSGSKAYKVVTQRDEFFESSFNPEKLQKLLNRDAARGWSVVSMAATDIGSFLGSFWGKGGGAARQELVVLLEKVVE